LSRFWLDVPDLFRFAHLCSRMLTHRWPKISSDFICIYEKNRWRPELRPGSRWGTHDTPPNPQVGPPTPRACGARTLRFTPSALVPDCGAQIIWSPYPRNHILDWGRDSPTRSREGTIFGGAQPIEKHWKRMLRQFTQQKNQ